MNKQLNPASLNSREVAKMVGKEHKNLIADIRGYISNMEESDGLKIQPVDFFQESSYSDAKGETRKCYSVTRKGCEFIANKLTGAKGTQFTAAYINKFHEMEQAIVTAPKALSEDEPKRLRALAMERNSRTRQGQFIIKTSENPALGDDARRIIIHKAIETALGEPLPIAPEVSTHYYDHLGIAEKLGILSKSENPHAAAVGVIIRHLDIPESLTIKVPYNRNGHSGTDTQYAESVIDQVKAWLKENNYPNKIKGTQTYTVKYRRIV